MPLAEPVRLANLESNPILWAPIWRFVCSLEISCLSVTIFLGRRRRRAAGRLLKAAHGVPPIEMGPKGLGADSLYVGR
jgi:hypothetical protein